MKEKIAQFPWTKLTEGQVEVIRCLAENDGPYTKKPITTTLSETCEVESHVAASAIASMEKGGLVKVVRKGKTQQSVTIAPEAVEYIRDNPYLGMSAVDAATEFLKDMGGGVRGTTSAARIVAAGTGYHYTTMSSTLQRMYADGLIDAELRGGSRKFIVACSLKGNPIPEEVTELAYSLEPKEWVELESSDAEEVPVTVTIDDEQLQKAADRLDREFREYEESGVVARQDVDEAHDSYQESKDYDNIARALLAQLIEKLSDDGGGSTTDEEADKMVRQIADLTVELAAKGVRIRELEQHLADGGRDFNKLRTDFNVLQARYNRLEEAHDKLREQTREARQEIREKKYPIPEEARKKLASLMQEVPGVGR